MDVQRVSEFYWILTRLAEKHMYYIVMATLGMGIKAHFTDSNLQGIQKRSGTIGSLLCQSKYVERKPQKNTIQRMRNCGA